MAGGRRPVGLRFPSGGAAPLWARSQPIGRRPEPGFAPRPVTQSESKMAEAGAGSPHGGDAAAPGPPEEQELSRRLRRLYPAVNQEETPLPRSWSPKDKYNYIGLSQGNLRVHYKGAGSRRPWSCPLGRDGTRWVRYPREKGCGGPGCGRRARRGEGGGLRAAGRGAVPALWGRGSRRCGPPGAPCPAEPGVPHPCPPGKH